MKERKNKFTLDGSTGKRIKEQKEEGTIEERNLRKFAEVQKLSKSWNPLPERGSSLPRLQTTVDRHSNYINCSQKYFNKGSYKGIYLKDTPQQYLKWVVDQVYLNDSELKLIRKFITK